MIRLLNLADICRHGRHCYAPYCALHVLLGMCVCVT